MRPVAFLPARIRASSRAKTSALSAGCDQQPLEAGEDGREFVAAAERQANLFDGRGLELGLLLEVMAHGVGGRANVGGSDSETCGKVQTLTNYSHPPIRTKPNASALATRLLSDTK